ncbi:nitrate reductase molybdenum cofactor assembly chaperone [Aquabacterium fontiphilum]|jgi:nitrate reductase delta subunit|uniref:nitrate reductase molybdenum cofactor assembly chaperone n=1 Tax=Aquabacterium fontiphilum TaxID=450365 RepID=UPI0013779DB7|nr:nitrate reductase molybdenum cofactor assembly chaperone [Aquabacterium fontiphilum]NBD21372.1 nitrate reductase molybdenum cofactor assembly chaperone [Aquabacterium fontiphilum]
MSRVLTSTHSSDQDVAHGRSLRVLARLLAYPNAALRAHLVDLLGALREEPGLSETRKAGLTRLVSQLAAADAYEVESDYVDLFDRGRATSLHLFEHVHGDSRDRGQAMVDLIQTYEQAGLRLNPDNGGELPDYLPLVLEFASTLAADAARGFTGEFAHILNALYAALLKRRSLYAHVPAAVLELMAHAIEPTEVPEDEALDDAWAEPDAFGGCTSRGQQRPDQPQPIHIVRTARPAPQRGA